MLDTARTSGYAISLNTYEQGFRACSSAVHADRDVVAVTASVAGLSREALTDVVVPKLQATALAIEHARAREVKFSPLLDQRKVIDPLPDKRNSPERPLGRATLGQRHACRPRQAKLRI